MRTKTDIIGHLFEDAKTAEKLGTLEHLTDISLLEVFIDIRDILDNRLLEINRDIDKILGILKGGK